MNPYSIIAALALIGATASWGVWERGTAEHWKAQYSALQASYTQAALKAETDAKAKEAADLKALNAQSTQAIQQAQSATIQARNQLTAYQAKLAAAATVKDLGHRCAGVEIPNDLLPN